MEPDRLAERLRDRFPDTSEARGEVTLTVTAEGLVAAIEYLRGEPDLRFDFLSDLTASDWPGSEPRFWLAYHLLSLALQHRVRAKVGLSDGPAPSVPSITGIFAGADWPEREVYDLFGVSFTGHPDLRRIQMPESWEGHPLRRDEPLGGVTTQYKGGAFIEPPDLRGR